MDCFERKILRTILGWVQKAYVWRRRYNYFYMIDLYYLYGQPLITKKIKLNRLRRLWHMIKLAFTQISLRTGGGRMSKVTLYRWCWVWSKEVKQPKLENQAPVYRAMEEDFEGVQGAPRAVVPQVMSSFTIDIFGKNKRISKSN